MIYKDRIMITLAMLMLLLFAIGCGPSEEELLAEYESAVSLALGNSCAEALPGLEVVIENGEDLLVDNPDEFAQEPQIAISSLAQEARSACNRLASAETQKTSEPSRALSSLAYAANYFEGSMVEADISDQIAELWVEPGIEQLVTKNSCLDWGPITKWLPEAESNGALWLEKCGDLISSSQSGTLQARFYYRMGLDRYPNAPNSEQLKRSLADETIAYVENEPETFLFFPRPDGIEDTGEDTGSNSALIYLANGTDEPINLVLAGPEIEVTKIERCDECATEEHQCDGLEPSITLELTPGTYRIVLESGSVENQVIQSLGFADFNVPVQPFAGEWELEAGKVYPSCFVVTSSNE